MWKDAMVETSRKIPHKWRHPLAALVCVCLGVLLSMGARQCGVIFESKAPSGLCRPQVSAFQIPRRVTFCGERVPLGRADVRERLEREFYYLLDKEGQLLLYIKRAGRTDPVVEPILQQEDVPRDLKFVPVAESGLQFRATSPAGAGGYWQFMKKTAEAYGLRVDKWVDERRSLPLSTVAAVQYLKVLHEIFGSWTMALAAYNWGRGNVANAVKEQGTRNYYDLYLPEETERYIFRMIVLKMFLEDPAAYSIFVPEGCTYEPPQTVAVDVAGGRFVPMDVLSACAETPPRRLRYLNPWMLTNILHPGDYAFELPKGKAGHFVECVEEALAQKHLLVHVVSKGEFLTNIAEEYGVSVGEIENWNRISRNQPIHPDQQLVIQFETEEPPEGVPRPLDISPPKHEIPSPEEAGGLLLLDPPIEGTSQNESLTSCPRRLATRNFSD
jgi:membrane-bound lytic murein transglycosylase D